MIFPIRQDQKLILQCRCGKITEVEIKPIKVQTEEPKEKAISVRQQKLLDEDYNFPNKIASREIIKQFLIEQRRRKNTKPFRNQKALILTHIEGFDIKQILLPLGFQPKNIYIVEREKIIIDEINKRSFFDKMNKKHIDLLKYKSKIQFDLIYLDFKGNISKPFLKILQRLLIRNAKNGTIVYINLQMARETTNTIDLFHGLKQSLIESYEEKIRDKKNDKSFHLMKKMTKEMLEQQMLEQQLDLENIKSFKIKLKMEDNEIIIDSNIPDLSTNMIDESFKIFQSEMIKKEREYMRILQDANTKHLLRMKILQLFLKSLLNLYLENHSDFINYHDKPNFMMRNKQQIFPIKQLSKRDKNLIPILRYMSKSLIMTDYHQFIYPNKLHTPFLSVMFLLKEEKQLLSQNGFEDLDKGIIEGFISFYIRGKNLMKNKNLTLALDSYEAIKTFTKAKQDGLNQEQTRNRLDGNYRKFADNKLRTRLNKLRNIYSDFRKDKMIKIDEENIDISIFSSQLRRYKGIINLKENLEFAKKNYKNISATIPILVYYLILKTLKEIDNIIKADIEIMDAQFIDVKDYPIKEFIDKNFKFSIQENELNKTLKIIRQRFESLTLLIIDLCKTIVLNIDKRKEEDNKGGFDLLEEYEYVIESINRIIKTKHYFKNKHKEVKDMDITIKLTKEQIEKLIKEFVKHHTDKEPNKIVELLNNFVKEKYGYNPKVSEEDIWQIRENPTKPNKQLPNKTITYEEERSLIRQFQVNNPILKSKRITEMVNTHIQDEYNYSANISEPRVRATKSWNEDVSDNKLTRSK
jgi:hypothetical protein